MTRVKMESSPCHTRLSIEEIDDNESCSVTTQGETDETRVPELQQANMSRHSPAFTVLVRCAFLLLVDTLEVDVKLALRLYE